MSKVRFGLAGTGVIVREYHLPVMVTNPRVEIVAACDVSAPSVSLTAKQFGIPKTYSDFNDLAKDPNIDAVLVAVPNNLHATVAARLLRAGKHVICEKPMAPSVAEARTILEAAEASGMKLAIAHPWRCDQDFRWLHDVVAAGRLGKVFKVRCHAILTEGSPPLDSWRCRKDIAGGGALTDLGIHVIDAVSYVFDDKLHPTRVFAKTGNFFTSSEVEDTATAIYNFKNGLTVTVEAGWHHNFQNAPHGAVEIFGDAGYARTFPTELHCKVDGAWTRCEPSLHPPRPHIDLSMYAAQIDAFVDAVLIGKKIPCDGKQGLRNVAWLAAAYDSARKGEPIPYSGE
ncbi:MAG: Gfo/Idh/MocA family oxidoreductase [Candidatus Acidiferrales bacterium]